MKKTTALWGALTLSMALGGCQAQEIGKTAGDEFSSHMTEQRRSTLEAHKKMGDNGLKSNEGLSAQQATSNQ